MDATTVFFQFAAAQAVALAALLFWKGGRRNCILAAWVLVLAADMSSSILYTAGLYREYPHWIGIRYGLPLLHGPFLLFYVRALLARPGPGWPHLIPLAALKLYQLPFFFGQTGPEKLAYFEGYLRQSHPEYVFVDAAMPLLGLAYIVQSYRELAADRERAAGYYSDHDRIERNWLRVALAIQTVIWLTVLLLNLPRFFGVQVFIARYVYILVALWVFAIGYAGFLRPELFCRRDRASGDATRSGPSGDPERRPSPRPGMDAAAADRIDARLRECMESGEVWREGDLTVQDVSNTIGVPMHRISQLINERYGRNFFGFVNRYRVDAALRMLTDAAFAGYTILEIAYAAGFNSKSSFNAVFKEFVGMTPSQARRNIAQNNNSAPGRT